MRSLALSACIILALVLALWSAPVLAQETRATVVGRVTDASGGVIPGVTITLTNVETNVATPTVTNDEGLYRIPFLNPGSYELRAELTGFSTHVRKGLNLSINSEVVLDVKMEVGELSQSVTVTAAEPVLNTTSSSVGQVIDSKRVMELPILGNSAMLMSGLAYGMQRTEGYDYIGLHSTQGASAYQTSGGVGGNEWSIDGTPNSGSGRRTAYLPYTDAIDEFRVESTSFDAKVGHTTGAFITMQSKAGTNQFHGTLTENHWQQRWNATPGNDNGAYWKKITDADRAGDAGLSSQLRKEQRQPSGRSNNYAASIGGPVKLPGLYDGSDKLFFFFIFNGFKDAKSETPSNKTFTVPTAAHRQGDFSDLLAVDPAKYQIYDPLTTVFNSKTGLYERQPFANNIIPASRIVNPMYKFYEKLYPLPNHPPGEGTDTSYNYFNANIPFNWDYKALQNRVDYVHSETDKFFFRWSYNTFLEDRQDWTFETARYLHSNGMRRANKGVGADWVHAFSPTDVLHVSVAYNRYTDQAVNLEQRNYKPSDVGLPTYMDEKAGDYTTLPRVDFTTYKDVSSNYNRLNPISTATLAVDYSKYMGRHSLSFGWDARKYYRVGGAPGNTSGLFEFRNNLLRKANNTSGVGSIGVEWAAFMMGIPNNMTVETNDTRYLTTPYHGLFLQDNFRLTPKLTVNLGARVEYEGSIRERFDRGLRDWNYGYELPVQFVNAVKTGYEKVALPQRSAADFAAGMRGGVNYLGAEGVPRTRTQTTLRIMPRLGFAYKLADTWVVRGGYGMYYDTLNAGHTEIDQTGFSRTTSTIITNDNGVTWASPSWDPINGKPPMVDPFPVRADGTRFDAPYGNALGHLAYLGRSFSYIPAHAEPTRQHRWRLEVEKQLLNDAVVSVAYAGAFASHLGVSDINRNSVPMEYYATGNVRQDAIANDLAKGVTNPFAIGNLKFMEQINPLLYQQMTNTSFFTQKTMTKAQLLRPYPHIAGDLIEQRVPIGENVYNAMLLRFEKRFSQGWTVSTHYEFSHTMTKDWVPNSFDQEPIWRESDVSRPHRWVATSLYELPFGKDKLLLNRTDWLNTALGGWQLGLVWQMQSGEPVEFGNLFFLGESTRDIRLPASEQTKDRWFNTGWQYPTGDSRNINPETGKAYPNALWVTDSKQTPANYHARVFANRFNHVRTDKLKQLDVNIQKAFFVKEGVRVLGRVDLLNAPNHQVMGGPNTDPTSSNFGRVGGYLNTPRYIQFQVRVVY